MTTDQPRVVELDLPPRALWAGSSALTLLDIFPNATAVTQRDPALMVVAGAAQWSASLEAQGGLLTFKFENESCSIWRQKRWMRLTNGITLEHIRAGNILPQHLELAFTSRDSESRHTVTLEYWTFGPEEWEFVGWSYFSHRRRERAAKRLYAAGIDADFLAPSITFRFRLLPKPVDLERMRLLAYFGTAYPVPGRRR